MKIRYKEFNSELGRGDIDISPENYIVCNSYRDVAQKLLALLDTVLPGNEIKITEIDLEDTMPEAKIISDDDILTVDKARKYIQDLAKRKNERTRNALASKYIKLKKELKYKVSYTMFKNLGGNIEIESITDNKNVIKFMVWNIIKNDDYDREPRYEDLQIKIIKKIE